MKYPPYGWRLAPNGNVVRDATEQGVIARVRALRASGLTVAHIKAELRDAGVAVADPPDPTALEHLRAANVPLGGAATCDPASSVREVMQSIADEVEAVDALRCLLKEQR